jgi:hypothetical protein
MGIMRLAAGVCHGREAQTPRLVGACERQARVWGGGALRLPVRKRKEGVG